MLGRVFVQDGVCIVSSNVFLGKDNDVQDDVVDGIMEDVMVSVIPQGPFGRPYIDRNIVDGPVVGFDGLKV